MSKIDLFERAASLTGGDSETVALMGKEISLRRNFTGAETVEIINAHFDYPEESMADQVTRLINLMSDSAEKEKKAFIEVLLEQRRPLFFRMITEMGKICGFRGADGDFLT